MAREPPRMVSQWMCRNSPASADKYSLDWIQRRVDKTNRSAIEDFPRGKRLMADVLGRKIVPAATMHLAGFERTERNACSC
jgi:hypothetical protein